MLLIFVKHVKDGLCSSADAKPPAMPQIRQYCFRYFSLHASLNMMMQINISFSVDQVPQRPYKATPEINAYNLMLEPLLYEC